MQSLADQKTATEIALMNAQIAKTDAETRKVIRDTVYVPTIVGIGIGGVAATLLALILKAFGVIS